MQIVLASNNAKKLAELQALFDGLGVTLVRQGELGVTEAEEPHITFIENALTKARHASATTGLPAIADDSGLCVDALGGMPGVISANYATVIARTGVTLARDDGGVGQGGFGYDPLMFIPAFGTTVASLAKEVKNAHSHRAIAAAQMRALMQQSWHL
jgi:XTP/dITP diphosphohydrolase